MAVVWRDGLDEIRTSASLTSSEAYTDWLDRLFESYGTAAEGESLAEGAERLASALRGIADRYYGRSALVVSHPVILLAFGGSLVQSAAQREQVDALPGLATSILESIYTPANSGTRARAARAQRAARSAAARSATAAA